MTTLKNPVPVAGATLVSLALVVLLAVPAGAGFQSANHSTDLTGQQDVPLGKAPSAVVAADFNGDGHDDLAAATGTYGLDFQYQSAGVVVLFNDPTTDEFVTGGYYPLGGEVRTRLFGQTIWDQVEGVQPRDLAAADLNDDGSVDLVTANSLTDNVSVLLNTGGGAFTAPRTYAIGDSPRSVAVGDLDGDGAKDVVVANRAFGADSVSILVNTTVAGQATGDFAEGCGSPHGVGTRPDGVALADLDGSDGVDIVTANNGSDDMSALFNQPGGCDFKAEADSPYAVGSRPESLVTADLDGDGKVDDVAVANRGSDDVTVLLNDGINDGSDTSDFISSTYSVGSEPRSVAAGDVHGDGDVDLATANYGADSVTVLENGGSGGFSETGGSPYAVGSAGVNDKPVSLAAGSLGGIGGGLDLDLVTANNNSSSLTVLQH